MDYASLVGDWSGTCGFRLLPSEDFAEAPATARLETAAAGHALLIRYTWRHPEDGPADGALLAGSPDDSGEVLVAWTDSWGQSPNPMILRGEDDGGTLSVHGSYHDEWGWEIDIAGDRSSLTITMRNVVPAGGSDGLPEGPYESQIARFTRG